MDDISLILAFQFKQYMIGCQLWAVDICSSTSSFRGTLRQTKPFWEYDPNTSPVTPISTYVTGSYFTSHFRGVWPFQPIGGLPKWID